MFEALEDRFQGRGEGGVLRVLLARKALRWSFPFGRRMLVAMMFLGVPEKSKTRSAAFIQRAARAIWTARSSISIP
jgi:hypothetical protein